MSVSKRAKDLVEHYRLNKSIARKIDSLIRQDYNIEDLDSILDKLSSLIGGYGVEVIQGNYQSYYWQDCVSLYINMGDTYSPTIIYDVVAKNFKFTTMGDFVEKYDKKYGIR